uniref:Uncharacterized protein n=1 Tax=Salix viminalis TaxID=40686 RepID=A0A6N2K471_SALVM
MDTGEEACSWVVVTKITTQDAMMHDDATTGIHDHSRRTMVKGLQISFLSVKL